MRTGPTSSPGRRSNSGYPTVVTAHDSPWKVLRLMPDLYRALRFGMARRVIPRCRYLTAVSADLAADVQKSLAPRLLSSRTR